MVKIGLLMEWVIHLMKKGWIIDKMGYLVDGKDWIIDGMGYLFDGKDLNKLLINLLLMKLISMQHTAK